MPVQGNRSSYGRYLNQSKNRSPPPVHAGLGDLPDDSEETSYEQSAASPKRSSWGAAAPSPTGKLPPRPGSGGGGADGSDGQAEAWLAQMLQEADVDPVPIPNGKSSSLPSNSSAHCCVDLPAVHC